MIDRPPLHRPLIDMKREAAIFWDRLRMTQDVALVTRELHGWCIAAMLAANFPDIYRLRDTRGDK